MQNKLIIIFITFFSFVFNLSGQKLVNSPYSRFNLGTFEPAGSFRSQAMGGVETSIRDNGSINFSNPASYSAIDTNSFIFDFGVDYSMSFLSDDKDQYFSDDMNFDHLLMGFPIKKGWGVAAGVFPYSNGYYRIIDVVLKNSADYDPIVGPYESTHLGEGGYNKIFLGTGIKILKNFSVGINMTVLLGQINRSYNVTFAALNVFNNTLKERISMSGINFEYGLQYHKLLSTNYFINAGISLSSNKNYNTDHEFLFAKNSAYGSSAPDTITYIKDDLTKTFIPGTIRAGISVGKKDKFTAGFDYISTKWSDSKIVGSTGYAADVKSYLLGVEYTPDKTSNYSFLRRLDYRFGGHMGDNYLIIDGEQLKEVGASFGIGLPMRRSLSKTNLFFDFTQRKGPSGSNLFRENYFTMGISLNLYDFWFLKRRYE